MPEMPPCGWTYGTGFTYCGTSEPAPPPPYCPCADCTAATAPPPNGGQHNVFHLTTVFAASDLGPAPPPVPAQAPPPAPAAIPTFCTDPRCMIPPFPQPNYPGPYAAPNNTGAPAPAPATGPPSIPGATILRPSGPYITMQVLPKGLKVWRPGSSRQFPFDLKTVETSISVRTLIERLGGDKDNKITEAHEGGDGIWWKGMTIRFKEAYAKKSLAELGWNELRAGTDLTPLVVVLLKDKKEEAVEA